jgi:hypothetical protein
MVASKGTAVLLDSMTMSTVCRRQYRENKSSSKTQSKAAFSWWKNTPTHQSTHQQ